MPRAKPDLRGLTIGIPQAKPFQVASPAMSSAFSTARPLNLFGTGGLASLGRTGGKRGGRRGRKV
jgi:hypothetical protein